MFHIYFMQRPEGNFLGYLSHTCILIVTCHMRSVVKYPAGGILWAFKKYKILKHFEAHVFRLGQVNLDPLKILLDYCSSISKKQRLADIQNIHHGCDIAL